LATALFITVQLALPKLISDQLHTLADDNLTLDFRFSDLTVSLIPLRLSMSDINLVDKDNKPKISAKSLEVELSLLSLINNDIIISAIKVTEPYLHIEISKAGDLQLLQYIKQQATPVADKTSEPIALLFKKVEVLDGKIDLDSSIPDLSIHKQFRIHHLKIDNFHTYKQDTDNFVSLELHETKHSILAIKGRLDLEKQKFIGDLHVKKINITPYLKMLKLPINANISKISTDFSGKVTAKFGKKTDVRLKKGTLSLNNIVIKSANKDKTFVHISEVKVSDIDFNLDKRLLTIANIKSQNTAINVILDAKNQADILSILKPTLPNASSNNDAPFTILIKALDILSANVNIKKQFKDDETNIVLDKINIALKDISLPTTEKDIPLNITFNIFNSSSIETKAAINLNDKTITGNASILQLPLSALQPFVKEMAFVKVTKGQLNSHIQYLYNYADANSLSTSGMMDITDFKIRKMDAKKRFFSFEKLSVNQFQYKMRDNNVKVDEVQLDNSFARILINEEGKLNVQDLLVIPQSNEPSTPVNWRVNRVSVKDADIGFSDLSMQPSFSSTIKNLNGYIETISSTQNELSSVSLQGKVDRYAPVGIQGKLSMNTLNPALDINMDFKNVELTSFTPYAGLYAGYGIDKGQLSMELNYVLSEKRIKGKNHIVINQLKFGQAVKSDKIINLPIKFAIAILSDDQGVIDLGFDVKGKVDDPQFSLNSIIFKALRETIKKAITSPFKYLKTALGSKQKNIHKIDFLAGCEEIISQTISKLAVVAQIMLAKKILQLNVHGNSDLPLDKPALQEAELLQILSVETKQNPQLFLPIHLPYKNKELLDTFTEYFLKQTRQSYQEYKKSLLSDASVSDVVKDSEHYTYESAWKKMVKDTAVSNDEVNRLAFRRAQQVKAILVDKYNISPDRIFVLDERESISPSLSTRLYLDAQ